MAEYGRILEFMRRVDERASERVIPSRFGPVIVHERLSRVHDLNFLRADRSAGASAQELGEEAERIQGSLGLRHRRVNVMDPAEVERLEPRFGELGWQATGYVAMACTRPPLHEVDRSAVREHNAETLRPVWEEGIRSAPFGADDEVVEQLLAAKEVVAAAVPTRYLAAEVDGELAAYCELYSWEGIGQVEAVMTREPYRNRGLASALVLEAVERSRADGNDLTFLVALANDWPQQLYYRLGFDVVGRYCEFLVTPA
jgi:ribosomal protein S18 acetylase RimI-like enzyme